MIAVLFEVWPTGDGKQTYLDMAGALRPALDEIPGFVAIERFQSLANSSKLLSVSFWRNEEAIAAWRSMAAHRQAQIAGRSAIFENYRLRVASVVRDYGFHDREQAPADSRIIHERGPTKAR